MTEKDFWVFLKNALAKGRAVQYSGVVDSDDTELKAAGQFIGGHSCLPKNYQSIPIEKIANMGKLLFNEMTAISTKEVILMLLAHHPTAEALNILKTYNGQPDKELRIFAQLALDECEMWNE